MNKQKAMMVLYAGTWGVFAVCLSLERMGVNGLVIFAPIFLMIMVTFIMMYLAAKESIGPCYAKRNLALAMALSLFGGIGFVIWPLLVHSEIKKRNQSA